MNRLDVHHARVVAMDFLVYFIAFLVTFVYLFVLWVVVLVVYNFVFEPFDFGPLKYFAAKSALLLTIIAIIYLIPYLNWFSLIVWWIGLMIIFKKDFWECRILVLLIWGLSFIARLFLTGILVGR
jgi:hypothetical protein